MAVHDWTRVDAGIFHHFHQGWIGEIARSLNGGLLPDDYYALAEQIASGYGPDVLTLRVPGGDVAATDDRETGGGGVATLTESPPQVRFHATADADLYADKADAVVIRHKSGHRVVAMVEIVSPGNESSRWRLDAFVAKASEAMAAGVHLLIVDLFPPGPRDPHGIHAAIWGDRGNELDLPADQPLTCVAYLGGSSPEAFIEPVAVGDALPTMPLFLRRDAYISVPLEATYAAAWAAVPSVWRTAMR